MNEALIYAIVFAIVAGAGFEAVKMFLSHWKRGEDLGGEIERLIPKISRLNEKYKKKDGTAFDLRDSNAKLLEELRILARKYKLDAWLAVVRADYWDQIVQFVENNDPLIRTVRTTTDKEFPLPPFWNGGGRAVAGHEVQDLIRQVASSNEESKQAADWRGRPPVKKARAGREAEVVQ